MKQLVVLLVLVFLLTSCKYFHIFNSVLKLDNDNNIKPTKILSELPPKEKESKWYGFLVYDKELDMEVSFYFEDDSIFNRPKNRYVILDTLVWGGKINH